MYPSKNWKNYCLGAYSKIRFIFFIFTWKSRGFILSKQQYAIISKFAERAVKAIRYAMYLKNQISFNFCEVIAILVVLFLRLKIKITISAVVYTGI